MSNRIKKLLFRELSDAEKEYIQKEELGKVIPAKIEDKTAVDKIILQDNEEEDDF